MFSSSLHNESTFYPKFVNDLRNAEDEVIIESPFITSGRMKKLFPIFRSLVKKDVQIYVVTRDPSEHLQPMNFQAEREIRRFENVGVEKISMRKNAYKYVFSLLVLFSVFHIVRDVQQGFGLSSFATDVVVLEKNWCGSYCDFITYPFEIVILLGSLAQLIWGWNRKLAYLIISIFFVWVGMFLYDYLIFNT